MATTIQKWGNSRGIRIPKSILDAVHWKEDEAVTLTAQDDKIIIEKTEKRRNIKELFADFHEEYVPIEVDWGNPEGKEIW